MRLQQILNPNTTQLRVIVTECSQFIEESHGGCMFRPIDMNGQLLRKVKMRKRKPGNINEQFDYAFDDYYPQLRQRSVLATGDISRHANCAYIFPIDGYKFMYNPEIFDSSSEYQEIFTSIVDSAINPKDVLTDMLKFNYRHDSLVEGLGLGSEIIVYNIPHFYAVVHNNGVNEALVELGVLHESTLTSK